MFSLSLKIEWIDWKYINRWTKNSKNYQKPSTGLDFLFLLLGFLTSHVGPLFWATAFASWLCFLQDCFHTAVGNYCIFNLVLHPHRHDHHHHHPQTSRKRPLLAAKQMCFFLVSWPVTKGSGFLWRWSPWCLYHSMVELPAKCLLYTL